MNLINALLLIAAFICFVISIRPSPTPRVSLIAAGLALWVLVPLIAAVKQL